ncbi:hypothetical protein [Halioglobus sp. HI00S01]|uniref:hypothetical protein n=1 Tax=Halioglobus sp. HI00S01 TaxID=1822214 RepID=UPI0012E91A9A|nr:hypothetical protein [Halioglobus sp. HI00S01]
MTQEQRKAIADLRSAGYAISIWTPEELGSVSRKRVEDRLVEVGHEIIDTLKSLED